MRPLSIVQSTWLSIGAMLCLGLAASAAETRLPTLISEAKAAGGEEANLTLRWWQPDDDHMLVAVVEHSTREYRWRDRQAPVAGHYTLTTSGAEPRTIRLLYQCSWLVREEGERRYWKTWFRLPADSLAGEEGYQLSADGRRPYLHAGQQQEAMALEQVDAQTGRAILDAWRLRFAGALKRSIGQHDEHSLETLLLRRHGMQADGTVRGPSSRPHDLFAAIRSLTGFSDILHALPQLDDDEPAAAVYDQEQPEAIALPPVPVDTTADPEALPLSARYVPRSCMYLRWGDSEQCRQHLSRLASLLEQWSPGFWGAPADDILAEQLARLGLDEAVWQAWAEAGVDDLAFASWDAAFASGTNVLVYVHAAQPLEDVAAPHSHRIDQRSLLLATDAGLLKRALTAMDRQKALALDPHLTHAWQELPLREGEQERLFVFLSDYWFTNLLSPRWQILTRRLNQVDARIRLVEMIRELHAREHGQDGLPALATLKQEAPLSEADRAWIFADLREEDGRLVHQELGGIGDHPPIDDLPFDLVSSQEVAFYDDFRERYSRNWRQMDPVAIRWSGADADERLRVYVSPISRQSDYRQLQSFVLPQKLNHRIVDIPGVAAGLSVILRTEMASGLLGQQLPLTVNLQAQCFDTAPKSYRPDTWLEPVPDHDMISMFRTPAALIGPRLVFDRLLPMAGGNGPVDSPYREISYLDFGEDWYRPMVWRNDESNLVAIGVDPTTLGRIRDGAGAWRDSAETCDIYAWIDGLAGYQLRGKCMQLLVKNRSLANWRRANRQLRISRQLGCRDEQIAALAERAALPPPTIPAAVDGLPAEIGERSYAASAQRSFDNLPPLLTSLIGLESFVSVEPNAIRFETRLRFDRPADEASVEQEATSDQGLDFDEFDE